MVAHGLTRRAAGEVVQRQMDLGAADVACEDHRKKYEAVSGSSVSQRAVGEWERRLTVQREPTGLDFERADFAAAAVGGGEDFGLDGELGGGGFVQKEEQLAGLRGGSAARGAARGHEGR